MWREAARTAGARPPMMMRAGRRVGAALLSLATLMAPIVIPQAVAETVAVSELKQQTHIHGLAVDRQNPDQLLIATHRGLFTSGPDGWAKRVSPVQDFMGFTPDPAKADKLYASGHPTGGGNLGFVASTDNGVTWTQVSPGVGGPVDFHQMTLSAADPNVIFGAYGTLQASRDGGKTWSVVGPLPDKLIDLAASAKNTDTLTPRPPTLRSTRSCWGGGLSVQMKQT